MRKLLLTLLITLIASTSLDESTAASTHLPTPMAEPSPASTLADPVPLQVGSAENPLILALAPSTQPSEKMMTAGHRLARLLEALSGYKVHAIAPVSEVEIVDAFRANKVHIAVLTPFAYIELRESGTAQVTFASIRNGEMLYGAQFIAPSHAGFTPYFDTAGDQNTAEAAQALHQFNDRTPCWGNVASPSGHVIPLGYLNQAKVQMRPPVFLEGQGPLVRAVYAEGICDFGATYIDARNLPTLEADYPDVLEKVDVIWRIPPIIPYQNVAFHSSLPPAVRRVLARAFVDVIRVEKGKFAMQTVYGIEALQPAPDDLYNEFEFYVEAAGLEFDALFE